MYATAVRAIVLVMFLSPAGLYAQASGTLLTFPETFRQSGNMERDRIFTDYGNLYNQNNAKNFCVALLGAGLLANTRIDGNFQHWHSKNINSGFSHELSEFSKVFGEGYIFVPVMVTSAAVYRFRQERRGAPNYPLGDFTDRTFRGYLVGAPTLFVFQSLLGADRPRNGGSDWRPLRHAHGVSGHAFMGAIPFITAAQMTDKLIVKGLFYTLSTFCAWSRVNDDAHYLSQVALGWYLAYLSVRAVSETESRRPLPKGLTIFPVVEVGAVGIGVYYQH